MSFKMPATVKLSSRC